MSVVIAPDGPAWLRVPCTFWDGCLDAEQAIPASAAPRLRASHDWLRTALDEIATVTTGRHTMRQEYLEWAMLRFLGLPVDTTAPAWCITGDQSRRLCRAGDQHPGAARRCVRWFAHAPPEVTGDLMHAMVERLRQQPP